MARLRLAALAVAATLTLGGCATLGRVPYSPIEDMSGAPAGLSDVRLWADDARALAKAISSNEVKSVGRPTVLALSGGGSQGAYGAGFLTCWSETRTRPQFTVVTGTSVGGLIAPFAFLGPAYDPYIRQMFTSGETDRLLQFAGLSGVFGGGLFRAGPLERLVDHYVTRSLLDAIAVEYRKGRRLFVVTTDLDNQRTALWDMGRIAESPSPQALELFRKVLLASASIPGVFPPQFIRFQSDGHTYSEMHVDGGVTANLLVVPDAMLTARFPAVEGAHPDIYIVINGKISPDFALAKDNVIDVFARSFATTLKASTRTSLIATTQYARRHGWTLHRTQIAPGVPTVDPTDFDAKAMRTLFEVGCRQAQKPDPWSE